MNLIDRDELELDTEWSDYYDGFVSYSRSQINGAVEVQAIPLDKIKQAREQIIDEKDFAYADFEQYKDEVLHAESDELPDDDFRYGMERCLEILDKLIAESEKKYDR